MARKYLGFTETKNNADLDAVFAEIRGSIPPVQAFGGVYNVTQYGLVADDGVTDNSAALATLLDAVLAAGGGIVYFPRAPLPYRFLGKITIPNTGGGTPKQPPIRFTGGGASHAGQTGVIAGGSILDLRYAGAVAKIDTRGLGTFELDHLTLEDNGLSSTPFFQTTLTTVKVHDNRVNGNPGKSGQGCDQDAFVLGGTGTAISGGEDAPFQGYGSVIRDNTFSRIRRGTYHRVYCNNVVVRDNWFLHDCGSDLVDGAAFEVDGAPAGVGSSASGNLFTGNTIEVGSYPYPIKFKNSVMNASIYNGFYDDSVVTLAQHRIEETSSLNLVIMGFGSDAVPTLSEDGAAEGTTTLLTGHQGQPSHLPQGVDLRAVSRLLNGESARLVDEATGDYWLQILTSATQVDVAYKPTAGALENFLTYLRISGAIKRQTLHGSTEHRLIGEAKVLLQAGAGSELWLGANEETAWVMTVENQLQYVGGNATPFVLGGVRPTIIGSRAGNAALASLLDGLATLGLVIDGTTA